MPSLTSRIAPGAARNQKRLCLSGTSQGVQQCNASLRLIGNNNKLEEVTVSREMQQGRAKIHGAAHTKVDAAGTSNSMNVGLMRQKS